MVGCDSNALFVQLLYLFLDNYFTDSHKEHIPLISRMTVSRYPIQIFNLMQSLDMLIRV